MNEELKILANKTVDKIYRKIRRACLNEFHKFGSNIGIGADGTPTKYIDQLTTLSIKEISKRFDDNKKTKIKLESIIGNFNKTYTQYILLSFDKYG